MPAFDRVEVVPGKPRIFAVELTTTWKQLPKVPEGTYTVLLRHRATNAVLIYLADDDTMRRLNPTTPVSATPGSLDRAEWGVTEGPLFIESANVDLIWARTASSTAILEIIAQKGQLGPTQ